MNAFLNRFPIKYFPNHLKLACLAAFPVALTTDLLYKIWLNFVKTEARDPLLELIIVSDLLASSLFVKVGLDLYRMHDGLRNVLQTAYEEDARYGEGQTVELARFLQDYLKYYKGKIPSQAFLEAQAF
ncbi:MAG: hypothetical protein AAFW00_28820, partial [Bacteroidota bacterium]